MLIRLTRRVAAAAIVSTACAVPEAESVSGPQFFGGLDGVRTIGDGDGSRGSSTESVVTTRAIIGPGALGRPTVGAIDVESGHLLIGDATSCTIKRYRLGTLDFVDSLSRCGEGPGELRSVGGIVVSQSAISVIDYGGKRIVSFNRAGVETSRRSLPSIERGRWLYRILGVNSDTLTGLWATVGSDKRRDDDVVASTVAGARAVGSRLREPPVAALSPRLISGHAGCQSTGPSPGHIVVASSWAVESVVLDRRSLDPVVRFARKVPWDTTYAREGGAGPVSPMRRTVAVCGPNSFAVMWESEPDGGDMQHVRMEVRDYDGRVLLRRSSRVGRDADHLVPIALDESRLYVVTADTAGYPLVAGIELPGRDGR